ncbi:MAG TPA: hypothetical protein VGM73_09275 [Candidatus Didemnitutus sp.]
MAVFVLLATLAAPALACLANRRWTLGLVLSGLTWAVGAIGHAWIQFESLAAERDWIRILILVIVGVAWGVGWSLANWAGPFVANWVFGLPFVLTGIGVALATGSSGDVILTAWLMLVVPALGARVLSRAGTRAPRSEPSHVVYFGVGLTILVLLGFALGVAHLAHPWVLATAMLALTVWAAPSLTPMVRRGWGVMRAPSIRPGWTAILGGAFLALLLVYWMAALAPETGSDATGGRIALPVMWLREGALTAHPEIELSYMGVAGESLFLLLLPMGGQAVGKVVAFACLSILSAVWILPRDRPTAWGLGVAFAFAGSTIVGWQLMHGFVDLLQATLLFGAVESTRRWTVDGAPRHLFIAGLIGGTASAIKLNGVVALIFALGCVVLLWRRQVTPTSTGRSRNRPIVGVACLLAGATLSLLPFLARSFVLTSNPVYPFASWIFPSPLDWNVPQLLRFGVPIDWQLPAAAIRVFFEPGRFAELGSYHPAFLSLIGAALISLPVWPRPARFWAVAGLVGAVFWFTTEQNLRYSLFVAAFGSAMLAEAGRSFAFARGLARHLLGFSLVALTVAGLFLGTARPASWMWQDPDGPALPLNWCLGRETTDHYLTRQLPAYAASRYLANHPDEVVGTLWQVPWLRDQLSFGVRVISLPHGDARLLRPLRELMPDSPRPWDARSALEVLHRDGITHLLIDVDTVWIADHPETEWPGVFSTEFLGRHARLLEANQRVRLYRLEERPLSGTAPREIGSLLPGRRNADIPVTAGRLYEFKIPRVPASPSDGAVVEMAWYDARERLLLYEHFPVPSSPHPAWHRWLQTAPDGSAHVMVYPGGHFPELEVRIFADPAGTE